jgi:hypothetical protein
MSRESEHMALVASVGCVVCRRLGYGYVPAQVHHIAQGSSKRSDFATAPLCHEHHQGPSGWHSRGKEFLRQFKVPGETEYGLLVWTIEDITRYS